MPYTHTTWADLRTALSLRLGDANQTFWVVSELTSLLYEAIRTFGLCSGFWRERGSFATTSGTAFYDITTEIPSLLGYTVTDRDIIKSLQYHLLESATSQAAWSGTEMFTLDDLRYAVERRRNQFLSDTGTVLTRSLINVASPPIGRQPLPDTVIDVRRAAWLGAAPLNYYNTLWREDERMLTAADQGWSVNPGAPEAYSIMAPPPLTMQLAPVPLSSGQVELLSVDSGASLNPVANATVLGIPDDLTPAVKWGALADLLGMDGIARDPVRAQFAEERYQQYVQLGRILPVIIHAELNGVPLIPCTLQELDASTPNWENSSSAPADIAIAGTNMIALNPVPDGTYSVTLDVVRNADLSDPVQVGREQLDMILDYAEHLAMFKVGGAEWHATERQANNFLTQCVTYNQRLSAAALAAFSAAGQSQRQKQGVARRLNSSMTGVGALRNG